MSVITIDGQSFAVGVLSVKRNATIAEGSNSGTSVSGRIIRDVIGTYYNYTVVFGTSKLSKTEYDALYDLLTVPVESHEITIPYGQSTITFDAYITSASDDLLKSKNGNVWGNLSVDFNAIQPYLSA